MGCGGQVQVPGLFLMGFDTWDKSFSLSLSILIRERGRYPISFLFVKLG